MTITFEATYENGVIKPDRPIDLDERSRIVVTVERPESEQPVDPSALHADAPDPLDAVIGIGKSGPSISLAADHDRILYGINKLE